MKILIVDDMEENLYMLESLLKGSGYEVVSATNGAEALEKIRSEGADMIISDILMPVMDGFKLCKEVRADNTLKDIPLVFYTATYKDKRDEELALKLGADRYLIKPMEPDKLLKILQEVMRDTEKGKVLPKKPALEEEEEGVFKLYSERLIVKLEKKMLDLEREVAERKQAEEKIKHLNLMLRAIRKVNQLIVVEKDSIRLLQGVCDNLIENRGYNSVWIAILDESGKLVRSAEAGLGKEFLPLAERLKSGDLPYCGRKTLSKSGVVVIKDPSSSCTDCPLSEKFHDAEAMSIRLEYEEKVYGMLVVSIPAGFVIDEKEQSLFHEVAGDIAFALHDMELEEERKQAEEALKKRTFDLGERVKELNCLYSTSSLVDVKDISLNEVFQEVVDIIPSGWQYPEITCARIIIEKQKYITDNFKETKWKQASDIVINGEKIGTLDVCYLKEKQEIDEGPFSKEERNLINAIAEQLGRIIERKRAEEVIKMLSAVVEQSTEGMAIAGLDGNLTFINEAWYRMHGYKSSMELLGKNLAIFHNQEQMENEVKPFNEKVIELGAYSGEVGHITRDGKPFPTLMTTTLLKGKQGKLYALAGIAKDITEHKLAEEALQESEKRYRDIFNNAAVSIWEYDISDIINIKNELTAKDIKDFNKYFKNNPDILKKIISLVKLVDVNDETLKLYGAKTKEELFKEFGKHHTTESLETYRNATIAYFEGKYFYKCETVNETLDGKLINIIYRITFPIGIHLLNKALVTVTDITEQKHADEKIKEYSKNLESMVEERTRELNRALYDTEASREKIDGILKSVSDGLIVTDIYNRITLMNRAAEDLLSVRFSEVIDRPIDFAVEEKTLREKLIDTYNKKKTDYQFDFELPGDDPKSPRFMRARTSVIYDREGKHTGIVTIFHDVTHEREVDRMKTEFLSTAAHELRSPLTSIQGFSEILQTREDLSEEEKIRFLSYINKQAVNLAEIVSDLLDISRIESGQKYTINKEICNTVEAIKNIIPYFQEISSKHKFEVVLPDKSVKCYVDKEKMEQTLKNILSNAVKYSPEGGVIRVSGEVFEDYYQVSVEDQGIGMTPEHIEKIFDKFYRADASDTAIEGTGLGMSIVKYIVEAHGGKVWVESEFEKGTTVRFTIPLK